MVRGLALAGWLLARVAGAGWGFTEVSGPAGLDHVHGYAPGTSLTEPYHIAGGVAVGDVDGDRWPDLFVVTGTLGPDRLYLNRGDGTFASTPWLAGGDGPVAPTSGPLLADLDGDADLDLFVGGIDGTTPRLYWNRGDGVFDDGTDGAGIWALDDTFSAAAGDYDGDGDVDLVLSHWSPVGSTSPHLWQNQGNGTFEPRDFAAGLASTWSDEDWTFTPALTDLDRDGRPDLLVTGDFGTTQLFRNVGGGAFERITGPEVTDENGMGLAIGDVDNDGELDWFVSSIFDPDGVPQGNWGTTGNRLYRGLGSAAFEDATEEAGVRHGFWGWGSCFADFDRNGWLDLYQTNGFSVSQAVEFHHDPARLFVNRGDGTFDERGAELGVADEGQGRGIACFDYDRDGDVDLFVANDFGAPRLFRNDLDDGSHHLGVRLADGPPNTEALGAWLEVTAGGTTQVREIRAGSNFESQNPAAAFFGLGDAAEVDRLVVVWPDGERTEWGGLASDRELVLSRRAPTIPTLAPGPLGLLALLLGLAAWRLLRWTR